MSPFVSKQLGSLNDLLVMQVENLYDAEQQLTTALARMAEAASSPQVAKALGDHLRETERHVARLDNVFRLLNKSPDRAVSYVMQSLIRESEAIAGAEAKSAVRDAGLIAAAQRVEHYEIAGYGTVRSLARHLGLGSVAALLQETLDEESAADNRLTQLAEQVINPQALEASAATMQSDARARL